MAFESAAAQLLAGIGALYLLAKAFSFVRLLFSLFILPGISVRMVPRAVSALAIGI